MGKIRVRTLGDEKKEKEDKQKIQQQAKAKKMQKEVEEKNADKTLDIDNKTEAQSEKVNKKTQKSKFAKKSTHSSNYNASKIIVNQNKKYQLNEALELLSKMPHAKFDETVELHINTTEKGISGNVTLPHGTGKKIKIEIINQTENPKHVEEVVKKIESGTIDFDVLIATPDSMPKLAKVARFLGPRGLMPNPKNGTVTPKPNEIANKFQSGQINFKTEAKFPILHLSIGKLSFGEKKLSENIKTVLNSIQIKNIKNITLKSTMSPGIKLEIIAES